MPSKDRIVNRGNTHVVLDRLREDIYDGRYRPGVRLNISDLARDFGISPLPVREALRNLEAEGLIDIQHNRGAIVTVLTAADIKEIYLIRVPLEETATAEAAKSWKTASQLNSLERCLQQMDKKVYSSEWFRLHHRFHMQMLTLSGFPRIVRMLEIYRGQMRGLVKLHVSEPRFIVQMQSEHYAMLQCLRDRNPERIQAIVREHLARPVREILRIMGSDALSIGLAQSV